MDFDLDTYPSLQNNTKVKLLHSRVEFDYIISGSNAFLSCILARVLSDKGFTVAIINKPDTNVGFDAILNGHKFLSFLASELGIKVGKFESEAQLISNLFNFALHPENIHYFGENYRVKDYGYDGNKNYFIADISRTRDISAADKIVYANTTPIDCWARAFLPRYMKMRQLIGGNLIVTHWSDYMFGWTGQKISSKYRYYTQRPKTIMLFGAYSINLNINTESEAKTQLEDEVRRTVTIIKGLKKENPE